MKDFSTHKHSHTLEDGRGVWRVQRLWELARGLPVEQVAIADIVEFEQDCWFGGRAPSCREVAEHAHRIFEADLSFPIILSSQGHLMDGGHRIAKAHLAGQSHIQAVRFETDPEPDEVREE